jgi:hypothetical protein
MVCGRWQPTVWGRLWRGRTGAAEAWGARAGQPGRCQPGYASLTEFWNGTALQYAALLAGTTVTIK